MNTVWIISGAAQVVWVGTKLKMEKPIADLSDVCLLPSARLDFGHNYSWMLMVIWTRTHTLPVRGRKSCLSRGCEIHKILLSTEVCECY